MNHTRASVLSVCTAPKQHPVAITREHEPSVARRGLRPSVSAAAILGCTLLWAATVDAAEAERPTIRPDSAEWIEKKVRVMSSEEVLELINVRREGWFAYPQWATATSLTKNDRAFLISSAHVLIDHSEDPAGVVELITTPVAYFFPSTMGGRFDHQYWMDTIIQPEDVEISENELEDIARCMVCWQDPPGIEDAVAGRLRMTPTSVSGQLVSLDGRSAHVIGTILETSWAPEDGLCGDEDRLFIPQFVSDEPLESSDVADIRSWISMRVLAEDGQLGSATTEDVDEAWSGEDEPTLSSTADKCRRIRGRCIITASDNFQRAVDRCEEDQSWWNSVKKLWPASLKGAGIGCASGGACAKWGKGALERIKGGAGILYGTAVGMTAGACVGAFDNYQNNVACFDQAMLDHRIAVADCNLQYENCIDGGKTTTP